MPAQVAGDFRRRLGSWEHFEFPARNGLERIVELGDGESFKLGDTVIPPFLVHED